MYRFLLVVLTLFESGQCFLLYPASTVLQMIGSISVPVIDLTAPQKIFFDWGFQMNYDMPFNLSSFYMVPIFPYARSHVSLSQRDVNFKDYTVDELYMRIENSLERFGFHKSCLERSICELQQYPFDVNHLSELTDIVIYLLTPSQMLQLRKGQLNRFTTAELQGLLGQRCEQKYPECEESLLSVYTEIN